MQKKALATLLKQHQPTLRLLFASKAQFHSSQALNKEVSTTYSTLSCN